jgi:hypothetical protein
VLAGARGPSDGSAGAKSNVPSALGVLRHAQIYKDLPAEIEEAFVVLEQHVMRDGTLYPVVLSTMPFLLATMRRGSVLSGRIALLIARYASIMPTLDKPLRDRLEAMLADHAGDIVRWFGRDADHDRAIGMLALHVPALRAVYLAAVEGAERLSAETLFALGALGEPPPIDTRVVFTTKPRS